MTDTRASRGLQDGGSALRTHYRAGLVDVSCQSPRVASSLDRQWQPDPVLLDMIHEDDWSVSAASSGSEERTLDQIACVWEIE